MHALLIRMAAFALAVLAGATAQAQASLTATPPTGRPGAAALIRGTDFAPFEAVDVYLNTSTALLLVSNAEGAVSGLVPIDASTPPGNHYLTAIGRRSGTAAQMTYRVSTSWGQSGFGSAHTAFNPWENVLSPASVPGLGVLWSVDTNSAGRSAAVSGGRVYVPTIGAGVLALSTSDGSLLWQVLSPQQFCAAPAVVGNTVYVVTCQNATVYALNAINGAVRWSRTIGGFSVGAVTVAKGLVYVGLVNVAPPLPALHALDGTTGAVRWATGTCCLQQSAAVANDVLYYGSSLGTVHAVNALTGAALWEFATGAEVRSTPAVANNVLYVGAGNRFFALHTGGSRAGSARWTATMPAPFGLNDPAVAQGVVYAATGAPDPRLYALDTRTGTTRWSVPTDGALPQGAAVANGVVYYTTSGGGFYAVAASNGAVLATASLGSTATAARTPAVSDGVIFLNDGFGKTHALAPLAGNDSAPRAPDRAPDPTTLRPDLRLRPPPATAR